MNNFFTRDNSVKKRKRPRWMRGDEWTDDEIDTSDIPPLTEEDFARGIRNPWVGRLNENTPVVYRWDCIEWLKEKARHAAAWLSAGGH